MKLFVSIAMVMLWFFPCFAQGKGGDGLKPPAAELQFGLQLEYPSLRVVGQLRNNAIPVFLSSFLGVSENPIDCRDLEGKPLLEISENDGGYRNVLAPFQFRAGEDARISANIRHISSDLTYAPVRNIFLEMVWKNTGYNTLNNDKPFKSNAMVFYAEGESEIFDPARIPVKQDLDLILAPRLMVYNDYCDTRKYEIRDLVFFMRNNAKKKILEVKGEVIGVLAADGKQAMIDGVPFTIAVANGVALGSGKFLKESQSLQKVYSTFAKTQLPAGFYRLRWQVEVRYEDNEKKSFSSNELWVYHNYEETRPVKIDLKPK